MENAVIRKVCESHKSQEKAERKRGQNNSSEKTILGFSLRIIVKMNKETSKIKAEIAVERKRKC